MGSKMNASEIGIYGSMLVGCGLAGLFGFLFFRSLEKKDKLIPVPVIVILKDSAGILSRTHWLILVSFISVLPGLLLGGVSFEHIRNHMGDSSFQSSLGNRIVFLPKTFDNIILLLAAYVFLAVVKAYIVGGFVSVGYDLIQGKKVSISGFLQSARKYFGNLYIPFMVVEIQTVLEKFLLFSSAFPFSVSVILSLVSIFIWYVLNSVYPLVMIIHQVSPIRLAIIQSVNFVLKNFWSLCRFFWITVYLLVVPFLVMDGLLGLISKANLSFMFVWYYSTFALIFVIQDLMNIFCYLTLSTSPPDKSAS